MEAAISDSDAPPAITKTALEDFENRQVATFCNGLDDHRVPTAVLLLARGLTKKQAAVTMGIDRVTLWRLCEQHPIEEAAAAETESRAKKALLKLAANMSAASDVLVRHVHGKFDPKDDEQLTRSKLQQQAAKATLAIVKSLLDAKAAANTQAAAVKAAKSLPDPDRVGVSEALERLRKR